MAVPVRGVFLDIGTLGPADLDLQPLVSSLPEWVLRDSMPAEQVASAIRDADVVVSNKVVLDAVALRRAERLKLICIAATGTNNVDLAAAARQGITVCNARAYATTSVVEHVFSLLLMLVRHIDEYRLAVARGDWQQAPGFCLLDYPIRELAGQSLGIIGYGELGRAVARMGRAYGMDILIARRPGTPASAGRIPLDELLQTADVISLHCPLSPDTRNLIGPQAFRLMRNSAILINTARGGIVDEAALCRALQDGEIAGAAVDVLSEEPPRHGNPLLEISLPNLLVTPHIAWAGRNARQALVNEIAANVRAFLDGRPRNQVEVPA
ncbi:MAG: 2-hydroxyacid dehydrogenase [Gammaproteobacteria bacterium]